MDDKLDIDFKAKASKTKNLPCMGDKLFLSTDNVLKDMNQHSMSDPDSSKLYKEKRFKIKSNKDLRNVRPTKSKPMGNKSKGPHKKTVKKLNTKLCWEYLGNKENITKYMKKKKRKMVKEELKEKLFDFKKQKKICNNLKALDKFTRLQTKRTSAFKGRSASIQHKLSTYRRNHGSNMFDTMNRSFFRSSKDRKLISTRKFSNLYPKELQNQLKRDKQKRVASSTSTLTTKLSTEFYLEYFKILNSIQSPGDVDDTIKGEDSSSHRKKTIKRRMSRVLRPKSAPGLRKISKINIAELKNL